MRASSASLLSIDVDFDDAPPTITDPKKVAWPLLLMCAFVAVLAGAAALAESPLGKYPTVRPYADAARGGAADAWRAIAGH